MPYDGTGLDETAKVLLEARRLVAEGWCQGTYEDDVGRVCLNRALTLGSDAADGLAGSGWQSAYRLVLALIPPLFYDVTHPIQVWNDAPDRTQAEVLALLDRAIAGADAEP